MRLGKFTSTVIIATFCGVASCYAIADDLFLNIDGLQGESVDALHPNEVVLQSYNVGVSVPVSDFLSGKADARDLTAVAFTSKVTPRLFVYVAMGTHIPTVTLTVRSKVPNQAPFDYLKIKLTGVLVVSVSLGSATGTGRGVDTYTFNYEKIEFEYTPRNADGTAGSPVRSGFDFKRYIGV